MPPERRHVVGEQLQGDDGRDRGQQVGHPGYADHPALMPVELARRLIRLYSFVGDAVLDPFMGAGTTARAAGELSRRFVGYEVNPGYRPIIERRLNQPLDVLCTTSIKLEAADE